MSLHVKVSKEEIIKVPRIFICSVNLSATPYNSLVQALQRQWARASGTILLEDGVGIAES